MRFVIALFLAVATAAGGGAVSRAQQVERVAAIVNDDVVSTYDLQMRLQLVMASAGLTPSPKLERRLEPQVLRGLIDDRLRLQEAKRRNISVTKADFRAAIATLERQNHVPPGKFDAFLAGQGVPKKALMDQLRAQIAWNKLVRQRIAPRITVGTDEVQEVLSRLKSQQGQTEYHLAEIVLALDKPEHEAEVRRTAQRLIEQIKLGARFGAVARQFSQAASASVGGDIGWIPESALSNELRRVVPTMTEREVTGPITTIEGVEILLLVQKRRMLTPNPDDAVVHLRHITLPLPADAGPAGIKTQMDVARTLSETVKGCDDMERAGKEIESAGPTDLGSIRLGDLSTQVRAAVKDLPVGHASAPVHTPQAVSVFMVCDRKDPPSGLPSATEIERRLRMERIENAARRYMRDLRYAAVVDVRA